MDAEEALVKQIAWLRERAKDSLRGRRGVYQVGSVRALVNTISDPSFNQYDYLQRRIQDLESRLHDLRGETHVVVMRDHECVDCGERKPCWACLSTNSSDRVFNADQSGEGYWHWVRLKPEDAQREAARVGGRAELYEIAKKMSRLWHDPPKGIP